MNFKNEKITVVGLGKSGIAVARLLAEQGARVRISEISDDSTLRAQAKEIESVSIPVELGGHSEKFFADADFIVPCPGVKPTAEPIQWAKKRGIPIYSELEIAYRFCSAPIIAITGTNGKTTVTTLVGQMLKNAGRSVIVGGNIGTPLTSFVSQLTPLECVVLEVSSFQLEYIEQFRPRIAAILNLTPDHLDHHKDIAEYYAMKARITESQKPEDWLVLNAADQELKNLPEIQKTRAKVIYFNNRSDRNYANENYKAAALIAKLAGVRDEIIEQTLEDYKGVEHRLEEVAQFNGVRFINDSKSTNVDSLRWALQNTKAPIGLIAGGRDKGGHFSNLAGLVKEKVKSILLIGEASEKIAKAFRNLGLSCQKVDTLKEAVQRAYEESEPGTTVLLSPGCASFDMFRNYEDRGEQFKKIVKELIAHAEIEA